MMKSSSSDQNLQFQPLVIIEFVRGTKQAAIEWLISHIQASKLDGGAELDVYTLVQQHNETDTNTDNAETILYIGAGIDRLLIAAEMMHMKKAHTDGYMHEFIVSDLECFKGSGDISTFFTSAEKQKIILKELNSIRATETEHHIPGYEHHKLYPGKSLIKVYLSCKIILQMFPLHEERLIKELGNDWYKPNKCLTVQPIRKIQQYFGEKIGLYFAFLGFYTVSLIPPALIGIIYFITSWHSVYREAIFAVFNLIWTTLFLEAWKRHCSELCFHWGTMHSVVRKYEEPRPDFFGEIGKNPVTGKAEPVFPKWQRRARFYFVSVPVTLVFMCICLFMMFAYFWMQNWADVMYAKNKGMVTYLTVFLPSVIYTVVIAILNGIYRNIAKMLNDFENHRLQSSYENHLILKLILFDFVNCFSSLFYVAFYLQNRDMLRNQLACLLITSQIIGQIREAMVPFFFVKYRSKQLEKAMKKVESLISTGGSHIIDHNIQKQASLEAVMDHFEGTIDDYLELFVQFGYVFLFSSAYPLAALWALLNNVTEIRADAFKMCLIFQRPFSESASSIGAWQTAFEVIGLVSVITNCALIGMDPEVQKLIPATITTATMVLIFVAIEHLVLVMKASIAHFIPDWPKWVEIELAKIEYKAGQAAIKERIAASKDKKELIHKLFSSNKIHAH